MFVSVLTEIKKSDPPNPPSLVAQAFPIFVFIV